MKYDIEDFLDALFLVAQNALPAKLLQIAAQKNDGIVIPPPQLYITDPNDQISNASVLLKFLFADSDFSGMAELCAPGRTIVPTTAHVVIDFDVQNPGVARLREKLAHRYRRALIEIYNEALSKGSWQAVSKWRVLPLPQDLYFYEHATRKQVGVAIQGGIAI